MLDFERENLKELHFITEKINFPIVIAVYNEWEKVQLNYLFANMDSAHMNSEEICRWCMSHNLKYQFFYPLQRISIIKNPYKYLMFLLLKAKLKIKYTLSLIHI